MRIRNGSELTITCDSCLPVDAEPASITFDVVGLHHTKIDAIEQSAGFVKAQSDDGAVIRDYCPDCANQ